MNVSKWTFDHKQGENGYWLNYNGKNKKGETITICLSKHITDITNKKSIPVMWKKEGYTKEVLKSFWYVETYVEKENLCVSKYNPTEKLYIEKQKNKIIQQSYVLDFDWVLEATEENATKILNEIERLFLKC